MNLLNSRILAALVALVAIGSPALAQHHDHHDDGDSNHQNDQFRRNDAQQQDVRHQQDRQAFEQSNHHDRHDGDWNRQNDQFRHNAQAQDFHNQQVQAYQNDKYDHKRARWQHHQEAKAYQANANKHYDWSQERSMYSDHWNRVNAAQQAQYDAQMRAQWMAYHHNNYNGNPNWNNYNDPAFLDYVHNSNPSLLTNLRSILGF